MVARCTFLNYNFPLIFYSISACPCINYIAFYSSNQVNKFLLDKFAAALL